MFTWVGNQLTTILDNYAISVVQKLMPMIAPVALVALTIWIVMYGWALTRNEVSESVPTFVLKVFKISIILAFSLQASFYVDNVAETANGLATGVATTFLPQAADQKAITSPYELLDTLNAGASTLTLNLLKQASITRLDYLFAAVVFSFGNVIFLCIALFVVSLAKVFMTFVIAIGPLFILSLAWKPTARFFDSWLSMVLNAVVLAWFVFFALGFSSFMGGAMVQVIQDSGGFQGPQINVVADSIKYTIVMVLMAIICFQAPSLASGLTGGPVIQQGVQLLQNALIVSGLRSKSNPKDGRASGAGGVVRRGAGLPYAAGRATGKVAAGARRVLRSWERASRIARRRDRQ
jgi:type IV secretion system protein VirB6